MMYYNQFNNKNQSASGNTFNYDASSNEYNFNFNYSPNISIYNNLNIPSYGQTVGQPNSYALSYGQPLDLLGQQNQNVASYNYGQSSDIFEQPNAYPQSYEVPSYGQSLNVFGQPNSYAPPYGQLSDVFGQPNQDMVMMMNTMLTYLSMMYSLLSFMKFMHPSSQVQKNGFMNSGTGSHTDTGNSGMRNHKDANMGLGSESGNNSNKVLSSDNGINSNTAGTTRSALGDMEKSGSSSGSASGLSGSFKTIKDKGGKVILDWDNTIDTDDNNTITEDTVKWLKELAASGVDTYIVSGNKGSDVMLKRLKEIDPEHKDFWENVINKNYTHAAPGKKDKAYERITGGDYSKTVLLDDTTANIDDWKRLSGNKGLYYQPKDSEDPNAPTHATYKGVTDIMSRFANSL